MNQMDIFDETLQKKIERMEKWCLRIQKEVWFLKEVYNLTKRNEKFEAVKRVLEQTDMFKSEAS